MFLLSRNVSSSRFSYFFVIIFHQLFLPTHIWYALLRDPFTLQAYSITCNLYEEEALGLEAWKWSQCLLTLWNFKGCNLMLIVFLLFLTKLLLLFKQGPNEGLYLLGQGWFIVIFIASRHGFLRDPLCM